MRLKTRQNIRLNDNICFYQIEKFMEYIHVFLALTKPNIHDLELYHDTNGQYTCDSHSITVFKSPGYKLKAQETHQMYNKGTTGTQKCYKNKRQHIRNVKNEVFDSKCQISDLVQDILRSFNEKHGRLI